MTSLYFLHERNHRLRCVALTFCFSHAVAMATLVWHTDDVRGGQKVAAAVSQRLSVQSMLILMVQDIAAKVCAPSILLQSCVMNLTTAICSYRLSAFEDVVDPAVMLTSG